MLTPASTGERPNFACLVRSEALRLRGWTERGGGWLVALCIGTILTGAGLYGAAMGSWRDPIQAGYVAVKFPLIVCLTAAGNALLNAMLAPLLGLNISLRQSFLAVLISFAIAAAILGSFSPLIAFLVWNAPPMSEALRTSSPAHSLVLLSNVIAIAFAGVTANIRLEGMLCALSGNASVARRVLLAWLAVNLFLGSQLSWIFRPFIGSPGLPVEFLRSNAFEGSFYESVFRAFLRVLHTP
jgi:hypothetical protein